MRGKMEAIRDENGDKCCAHAIMFLQSVDANRTMC